MNKIVFTGGGSAGHVTPNLALISELRSSGWTIDYIGSADGIEKGIITEAGIPFHAISSGKLRRYFDIKNFKDPFKVIKGVWDAYRLLGKLRPDAVFSKGGFVTVPVVVAAKLRGIPAIIHESDMTPGLANKLSAPFAKHICVTFPETLQHIKGSKGVCTGLPIRSELLQGRADKARAELDFLRDRPVLLVMGGSLGAKAINEAVRSALPDLLSVFQIIHICGKGHLDEKLSGTRGYRQFEYISSELPDYLALADAVVSRAGATSLFEFLALRKPMLLIPLSRQASRGDQILNARSFEKRGYALVIEEEALTGELLQASARSLYEDRERYRLAMSEDGDTPDAAKAIAQLIRKTAAGKSR